MNIKTTQSTSKSKAVSSALKPLLCHTFWEKDGLAIVNGDCLKIMDSIEKESIDFIFCDPPFNVGKNYGGGAKADKKIDYREWTQEWIDKAWQLLKPTGSIAVMNIIRNLPLLYSCFDSGILINQVAWRNVSASHSKRGFWNSYQPITIYGKTEDYYFDTYAEKKIIAENLRWGGYSSEAKGQLLDYWDDIPFVYAGSIKHPEAILKKGSRKKEHPAQMPTKLIGRLIKFFTKQNDIILDPMMGIGTTLVAAHKLNRRAIGIELNEHYCKKTIERFNQTDLLTGAV